MPHAVHPLIGCWHGNRPGERITTTFNKQATKRKRIETRSARIKNDAPMHDHCIHRRMEDVWLAKQ